MTKTNQSIQFTNSLQNIVKDFQVTFGHPAESKPTLPTLERFTNRKGFGTIEEAVEQLYSIARSKVEFKQSIDTLHKYLDKAMEKQLKKPILTDKTDKIVALADGLGDELWFLLGDCVEAGIDIQPVIEIIEASNNSKLFIDDNGNKYAKEDENGKIIKSEFFYPPEDKIKEEVLRQMSSSKLTIQQSISNGLVKNKELLDKLEEVNNILPDGVSMHYIGSDK